MSITATKDILEYAIAIVPPEKLAIGTSVIGYDWRLPYVPGVTKANSLSVPSAIKLAGEASVTIQFDEESQTPFLTTRRLLYLLTTSYGLLMPEVYMGWLN